MWLQLEADCGKAKDGALQKEKKAKSIRESEEWVRLVYLKDKLLKEKIHDMRAMLEVQKLIEIYGGSLFYLHAKGESRGSKMQKEPSVLVKGDLSRVRTDFEDCLIRANIVERIPAIGEMPNCYAPTRGMNNPTRVYETKAADRSQKSIVYESTATLSRSAIRLKNKQKNNSKSKNEERNSSHCSTSTLSPKDKRPILVSQFRGSSNKKKSTPSKIKEVKSSNKHHQKKKQPLKSGITASSKSTSPHSRSKSNHNRQSPSPIKRPSPVSVTKSKISPAKNNKNVDKVQVEKQKAKKVANIVVKPNTTCKPSKIKPSKDEIGVSKSKNRVKKQPKQPIFIDSVTLAAETSQAARYAEESKSAMMDKGKLKKAFRHELDQIVRDGQTGDFYIVADNVQSHRDQLRVNKEIGAVLNSNHKLRPGKEGNKISKKGITTSDKCTQTIELPSEVIYPQVRYPTGYGPVHVAAEAKPKREVEKLDTWLNDEKSPEDFRSGTGYSTKAQSQPFQNDISKSALKKSKTKKSTKVSFQKSEGKSTYTDPEESESENGFSSSYQSSDPLAEFESEEEFQSSPQLNNKRIYQSSPVSAHEHSRDHPREPVDDPEVTKDMPSSTRQPINAFASQAIQNKQETKYSKIEVENEKMENMGHNHESQHEKQDIHEAKPIDDPHTEADANHKIGLKLKKIESSDMEPGENDIVSHQGVFLEEDPSHIPGNYDKDDNDSVLMADLDNQEAQPENEPEEMFSENKEYQNSIEKTIEEPKLEDLKSGVRTPEDRMTEMKICEPIEQPKNVTSNHIQNLLKNSPFKKKPTQSSEPTPNKPKDKPIPTQNPQKTPQTKA